MKPITIKWWHLLILVALAAVDWIVPDVPGVVRAEPITLTTILVTMAITAAASVAEYFLMPKPKMPGPVDKGRFDDIRIQTSEYGATIPRLWGKNRLAINIVWHTPVVDNPITTPGRGGGKGFGGGSTPPTPTVTEHVYTTTIAGLVCEGPVTNGIRRIWFDADLVWNLDATDPSTPTRHYEAESATLSGGAASSVQAECSGGYKVTGVGNGGEVSFSVTVVGAADYEIAAFYTSSSQLTYKISINGGATSDLVCPSSGGATLVSVMNFVASLNSGANTIVFKNAGAACPDLDKIMILPRIVIDPDPDPGDRRQLTGIINTAINYPSDLNYSWPYNNYLPSQSSVGTYSATLAKYGQPNIRIYTGTETQTADSAVIADKGAANAPAWRGYLYLIVENIQLQFGRLPNITVEADEGTTDLDSIVEDIYAAVGITSAQLNVTALASDVCDGLMMASRTQAGQMLEALQTAYQFDMVEVDGIVKAIKRSGASATTISYLNLRAHAQGEEMPSSDCVITESDALAMPARVDVNYSDALQDYHTNTQSDMALSGVAQDNVSISLPIVMDADQGKQLAITLRNKALMESRGFEFSTGPRYSNLHPGDVVTLALENATHVARIVEQAITPFGPITFRAVRQQASLYSPTGTGSPGTGFERPIVHVPANAAGVLIDGPVIWPADLGDGTMPVLYAAIARRGSGLFTGGFVYKEEITSSGDYSLVSVWENSCDVGKTVGALADADATVWDRTGSVVIDFYSPTVLSSDSEANLLARPNVNLIWIGANGAGEYIQFATATSGTPATGWASRYTISTLLRGRFGSENKTGSHAANDDVVVMTSALKVVKQDVDEIGKARNWKFALSGQALADVTATSLTMTGTSLKPLPPGNVQGRRNSAGDLAINWTRRERFAASLRDSVATGLNEQEEIYQLEILSGATIVRGPLRLRATERQAIIADRVVGPDYPSIDVSSIYVGMQRLTLSHAEVSAITAIDSELSTLYGFGVGFIDDTKAANGSTANTLWIEAKSTGFSARTLRVYEHGALVASYSITSIYTDDQPIGLRCEILNGIIRYWASVNGQPELLIWTSTISASIMVAWDARPMTINISPTSSAAEKKPTVLPRRTQFVYTAAMQTADFGSTQSSIKTRMYQESAIAGRGNYVETFL